MSNVVSNIFNMYFEGIAIHFNDLLQHVNRFLRLSRVDKVAWRFIEMEEEYAADKHKSRLDRVSIKRCIGRTGRNNLTKSVSTKNMYRHP
jgi:hypothetical protein